MLGWDGVTANAAEGPIVVATLAEYAGVPFDVAEIEQTVPCAPDAVNRPDDVFIPPQDDDQMDGMFAENCSVWPVGVVAFAGMMVNGEVMVTEAATGFPPYEGVPVTEQTDGVRGAVYKPVLALIEPHVVDHVTATFEPNC
jgi:hypothetical protein